MWTKEAAKWSCSSGRKSHSQDHGSPGLGGAEGMSVQRKHRLRLQAETEPGSYEVTVLLLLQPGEG